MGSLKRVVCRWRASSTTTLGEDSNSLCMDNRGACTLRQLKNGGRLPRPALTLRRRAELVAIGAAAILAASVFLALGAEPIIGRASVVDGDTIEIQGERIRLNAVDAPESGQSCLDRKGRTYRCGQQAALALDELLASARPTRCEPHVKDRYGRWVATCFAGGQDVGGWLVGQGWAIEYDQYSDGRYAADEARAQQAAAGIWQGKFVPPWDWRRGERLSAPAAGVQENGCTIKGNISRNGRIYHLPGQQHYDRTQIDTSKGERWFCTEQGAGEAGWRPAKR